MTRRRKRPRGEPRPEEFFACLPAGTVIELRDPPGRFTVGGADPALPKAAALPTLGNTARR